MKVKLILERKTFEMQLKGEVYRKVVAEKKKTKMLNGTGKIAITYT
jgi:hypothetical protein